MMGKEAMEIGKSGVWEGSISEECRYVHLQWLNAEGIWVPLGSKPMYDKQETIRMVQKAVRGGGLHFEKYRLIPADESRIAKTKNKEMNMSKKKNVAKTAPKAKAPARTSKALLFTLIASGVIKTALALTAKYKGKEFTATIEKDGVSFRNKMFRSLSAAASAAMASVIGGKPPVDGWLFWKTKDGNPIGDLRPNGSVAYREKTATKVKVETKAKVKSKANGKANGAVKSETKGKPAVAPPPREKTETGVHISE